MQRCFSGLSVLVLGLGVAACGSRPAELASDGVADDTACTFQGRTYQHGASFSLGDGCNTCGCDGGKVTCTARKCGEEPPAGSCSYQGKVYKQGETFPAGDGCNSCYCGADGLTGVVGCTARSCERQDLGVPWPERLSQCASLPVVDKPCDASFAPCWNRRPETMTMRLEICSCAHWFIYCEPVPVSPNGSCPSTLEGVNVGPVLCLSPSSPYVDCGCTCTAGRWQCQPSMPPGRDAGTYQWRG